jgi:hypothetical protein
MGTLLILYSKQRGAITFLATRCKMDNLLFWVVIGALGFLLYISPGFLIHRMYESFAAATTGTAAAGTGTAAAGTQTQEVNTTGAASTNLTASTAPNAASPTENALKNLFDMLNTPMPTTSPTAPSPQAGSNSGSSQPVEHASMRSQPESAKAAPGASEALKHGDLYKNTLPKNPQPGVQGMLGSMGTQARAPVERIVYIDRRREEEEDRCERPQTNPNCPDMRDYIRKDSIPCWGCKLR